MGIRAIRDHVLVIDMKFNERLTRGGILLLGDDKTSAGIRPRWAKVIAIGKEQTAIEVGQYVCIKHGRWTRGIKMEGEIVRRIDIDDILLVSDVPREDESLPGSDVITDQQEKNIEDVFN